MKKTLLLVGIMQNGLPPLDFFSMYQIRNCALFTVPPGFNKIYIFLKSFYLVIKLFIVKAMCAPQRGHMSSFTVRDTPGHHR